MDLYRIGTTVLNLNRINGILDIHVPTDPGASGGQTVLRILFDHGQIDLSGKEAEVIRRWYRHASQNLAPHVDEDGEQLVSPEDQVRQAIEALVGRIDRTRPRDSVMRHTAHRVRDIIDLFLTGELQPARISDFDKMFEEARTGQ